MAQKRISLNTVSEDEKWKVESDLRCVMECEQIENDPVRMKKVRALAKEKMLEVAAIASGESE
ncbi:hypothetical protein ACO0K3_03685 [Undibacterium sp. Rencai35W]|uniref:hypothetical protein n=1 Tax=Undibacterium sp. Rencai35W TaxID=3413046 RepID=UPI003BF0D82B